MRSLLKSLLLGLAILGLGTAPAPAQDFPTKPVTFIVPFPPGGLVDFTARPVAAGLERVWKQPMVVSNRPGASGGVGMIAGANARPDGYTLLFTHASISTIPAADAIFGRPPSFDKSQFMPLALIVADPLIVIVRADSPWKTFEEFVAAARQAPGTIAYSSSGAYGAIHVPVEMLAHAAGIKLKHVAYTGGGPMMTALLGGHVQVTVFSPAVVAPQIKSGEIRPLLSTGAKRIALMPEVRTVYDLGYRDAEFYLWCGLFGPAKLPIPIADKIRAGVAQAVRDPEFLKHMQNAGLPVEYMDAPDFRQFWMTDAERIETAIKRIGKVE
ncbi:MAG TPA: tripartite tricarboxylate transporter substrate binding protein [Thermodesulfobacteriota bacterium]|nr:tripartite tricarboxylate transporter substrate binding protein [Thermodesulfobacteriota bacterium]